LMALGRLKEATEYLEKLVESEPAYPVAHSYLAWAFYLDSRSEDAIREMRSAVTFSDDDSSFKCELACLLGFAGRRGEASVLIEEVKATSKAIHVDKAGMAMALFGIGQVDEAFAYLEAARKDGSDSILRFRNTPWFARWREDPRWIAIDRGLGFGR